MIVGGLDPFSSFSKLTLFLAEITESSLSRPAAALLPIVGVEVREVLDFETELNAAEKEREMSRAIARPTKYRGRKSIIVFTINSNKQCSSAIPSKDCTIFAHQEK